MSYIFIIYSCKKNLEKANKTYEKIHNKLLDTKVYIIYGDKMIENEYNIIDDKYIVFNVNDDYDHLLDKTLIMIQTINNIFPSIKGMFKCDDDVIICIKHINTFITINNIKNNDYCGKKLIRTKEYNLKCSDKHPVVECMYAGGPLYYLSKKALSCFDKSNSIKMIYYEDMMVGYHLNKFNIFPTDNNNLYSDNIIDSMKISYHNGKHHNELYMIIQGGLGNQLFQLACATKMAEKYNKKFVLNKTTIIPSPHQNNNMDTTLTTLQTLFPKIPICNNIIYNNEYCTFTEKENECFMYTEKYLDDCFNVYNNVLLRGYFINYKYIPPNMFDNINIVPKDKTLLLFDFSNTYFIHIRLGDYLKHSMYQIDLKEYYNFCINKILSINNKAKFYICTNQYDNILKEYLKGFPKNINYTIQSKTNNDMDTLYIMSSCCGAICSNSTLSIMGSVCQKTPKNKDNIYMPYPFVKFINGFNESNVTLDLYPIWSSVYDTINNSIIQ